MTSKKQIATEVEYVLSLKSIMQTYEEIAAVRMQRLRSKVLESRDFLLEINNIFHEVKSSYKKQVEALMKKKKLKDLPRNGGTLLVFLSANTGLYGDIIRKTFNLFIQYLKKEKAQAAIIGKLGLELFEEEFGFAEPVTYFDLPDNVIDLKQLQKIASFLITHEKIIVFYEQFQNILSQKPIITNISGDILVPQEKTQEIKYFFEPSLEKILGFFEKEIITSIFDQIVFESQLAKFASRMVTLDKATENTKNRLKQLLFQEERIKHQTINKKQMETLASQSLWSGAQL